MAERREFPATVLWSVTAFGGERWTTGRRYWWNNRERPARGGCLQATLEGSVVIRLNGREHVADAGTIMIFLYGEDSQYGRPSPFAEPYRCAWISLEGAGVVEHLHAIREMVGPVLRDEPGRPLTEELRSLQVKLRDGELSQPTTLAAETQRMVMSVYESAARHRREGLTPVERAVERLLSQPFAPDNTQQIANRYGVSREHFTRVFTQRTGSPPARYLARVRSQRAVTLLQSTALAVDAVAQQVGLRDTAALGRLLRRETDRPPTAWRSSPDS